MAFRVNRRRTPKQASYKFLVSACLAGINCTYKAGNNLKRRIKVLVDRKEGLAVCPEVLGGLSIPRENSEIAGGDGRDVLAKRAKVITISGRDVSKNFINGAKRVLRLARKYKIKKAILKSRSPACGLGPIYDGTFRRHLIKGNGVLASLLLENGIMIYGEEKKRNT